MATCVSASIALLPFNKMILTSIYSEGDIQNLEIIDGR